MDVHGLDRREFLKSIAAVAVGAHLGMGAAAAQDADGGEPFRLGLIGCGGQGRNVLLSSALRVKGVQVVGVCDIVEDRRSGAAQQAGEGTPAFEDYRELLDSVPMDGVIIATPLHLHARMTIDAFERGLHVFCEKCMAYTIDECKEMLRAQQAAGKVLQIGHHLRYHPLYLHAKRAFIDTDLLGDITSVYAQWNRNNSWRRPVVEGDYTKWGYDSPDKVANWRLYKEFSGGLMTELASHQIDVVSWMLGKTPTAVTGSGGIDYYKDGRTVPDNVQVIFEYPGGTRFVYQSGTTNSFSMFGRECHEVIRGTKGTLVMAHLNPDPTQSAGWFFLEEGVQKELWMEAAEKTTVNGREAIVLDATVTEGPPLAGQPIGTLISSKGKLVKTTYQLEIEEFLISCREGKVPTCDGRVGIRSAADALLANQAIETKERIEFSEDLYNV